MKNKITLTHNDPQLIRDIIEEGYRKIWKQTYKISKLSDQDLRDISNYVDSLEIKFDEN